MEFDAPWTVFRGKYRLWRWPWREIFQVLAQLRRGRFDVAVSVRRDPRDHLLMWLAGARQRVGFLTRWSRGFLNDPILEYDPNAHVVENWWRLQDRILGAAMPHHAPRLAADPFLVEQMSVRLGRPAKPIVAFHCGARIAVRRWPEGYFRQLIVSLRQKFDFHLVLIPDPDGYGSSLADLADHTFSQLSMVELVALMSCCRQLICNDSGPGHIAAALGTPVIAIFGPTHPDRFRPFGNDHLVVIRDFCALRPCLDYCQFQENYCLTKLKPALVYPEIEDFCASLGRIPLKVAGK
jgi:heptosyltransferase-2